MIRSKSFYLILLVTVVSCAQQQAPTGGPKDTAPPRIISSNPQNFSTGFNEDFIELEFNEFVQLKGIQKQMIISPPLKEKLDIKTKGKSVRLPMPKSLKPNVTYVINFGEGITDITEFNPLDSNLFVFSTGDFIDSLKIRGKVKDAKSLKPLDAILVMLYEENIDSLPYQIKPTYVGKSDKRGMFEIPYLREGNYKIVALEDKNGNYLFDPVEQIGFLDSLVSPQDSLSFSLRLFQEDLEEQFLSSFKFTQPGKLLVKTNKPYENINIDPINYSFKKQWFVSDIYKKTDSAVFWFTDFPTIDTLELIVSIDDQIDTVAVNLVTQDSLNASVTCAIDKSTLNPYELLSFKSNVPMKEILSDSILIVRDTIVINAIFGIREGRFREVFLSDSLFESTRYKITFLPGALKSIFDTQNPDSITFEYTIPKKSDFPELTVSLDVDYKGATVLELFSNTDKELKKPLKTVRYSNVEDKMGFGFQKTGKYKLKLILDGDNDGQWSTGNYLEHVQPERVYLYDGVFELKPGFDLDIDWKIKP